MKGIRLVLAATLALVAAAPAAAQVDVSVTIGQPGFYGQIDLGDFPRPRLIYPQPVVVVAGPAVHPPMYLRVPPGHAKKWSKHCHSYGACGRPVYFVEDHWYENVYVTEYRRKHGHKHDKHGNGHGKSKHGGKGKGKD